MEDGKKGLIRVCFQITNKPHGFRGCKFPSLIILMVSMGLRSCPNKPLGFCERKTSLNQPRLNHPIADELFIVASQKSQSHSQATVRAVLRHLRTGGDVTSS